MISRTHQIVYLKMAKMVVCFTLGFFVLVVVCFLIRVSM